MCTWYPTDSQRNQKEVVGGSPVGKGRAVLGAGFGVPVSRAPVGVLQGRVGVMV